MYSLKELHQQRQQRLVKSKNLGDSDEDEDDTALTWVKRARKIREEKLQISHLDEQESDSEDSDKKREKMPPPKRRAQQSDNKNFDSSIVAGVKVLHSLDELPEQDTILTLADSKIVSDGVLNNEDELINLELMENVTAKKNSDIRAGKRKYDVYNDDQKDVLLPQYEIDDEEKEKIERKNKAIVIGESGGIAQSTGEKLQVLAQQLESQAGVGKVDGSLKIKEASDYYTQEEMSQFRKVKPKTKKRKLRKKIAEEEIVVVKEEITNDMGSRKDRQERQTSQKIEVIVQVLEKRDNYKKAIEKAESEASKYLLTEFEEEDDLYAILDRTRKSAEVQRKKNEEFVAEQLEKVKREDKINTSADSWPALFTPSEMETFQEDNMEDTRTYIEAMKKKQRERTHKNKQSDYSHSQNDDMSIDEPSEPPEKIEPVEKLLGAEPLVSRGMAATLELLRSRGGLPALSVESVTGRPSDKRIDDVNKDGDSFRLDYLDERGRPMTPKEAFRRLSYRFHGKAPGKNKDERRMKREEEELRRKMMSTTDTPLGTLSAIQRTQQQSKLPYVVMGGNTAKILAQKAPIPIPGTIEPQQTPERSSAGTFREIPIEYVPSPGLPKREELKKKKFLLALNNK